MEGCARGGAHCVVGGRGGVVEGHTAKHAVYMGGMCVAMGMWHAIRRRENLKRFGIRAEDPIEDKHRDSRGAAGEAGGLHQ